MSDSTMAAVQRALSAGRDGAARRGDDHAPTQEQTQAARDEVEYAAFSRAFGWHDVGEEPIEPRLVTMPKAEYDEMVRNAAMLPELVGMMRQRPAVVTPEDEAAYQRFALQFGW